MWSQALAICTVRVTVCWSILLCSLFLILPFLPFYFSILWLLDVYRLFLSEDLFALLMYSCNPAHWNLTVAATYVNSLLPSFFGRYNLWMSALGFNPPYMFVVFLVMLSRSCISCSSLWFLLCRWSLALRMCWWPASCFCVCSLALRIYYYYFYLYIRKTVFSSKWKLCQFWWYKTNIHNVAKRSVFLCNN